MPQHWIAVKGGTVGGWKHFARQHPARPLHYIFIFIIYVIVPLQTPADWHAPYNTSIVDKGIGVNTHNI